MKVMQDELTGLRHFEISAKEWFDKSKFSKNAEDIIAWKLAETFTKEELRGLIKIDTKKIEKKFVDLVAERMVNDFLNKGRNHEQ